MQVMVALVDAAGAVASREALFASCWGAMVVGDDALHRAVAGARRALRETGATDVSIETIPRVGYRLVSTYPPAASAGPHAVEAIERAAETSAGAAKATEELPATTLGRSALEDHPWPDVAAGRLRNRRRVLGAVAAAVTGLAAASVWQRHRAEVVPEGVEALLAQGQRAMRLASPEPDRDAVSFFDQATRIAPRHARAWGLLTLARQQVTIGAPPDQLNDALTSVEISAAHSLALDPHQADALAARALLVPPFGEWGRVAGSLQAILDRKPDHLPTLDAMATLLSSTGLVTEHYPLRLKTIELDPFHAGFNFRSIYSHWMNGQVAAADRAGERGMQLWPRHLPTWLARHSLFKYTARAERALSMLEAADSRPPLPAWLHDVLTLVAKALASGDVANRVKARDALLISLNGGGPLAAISATLDLAALGETMLALDVTEAFLLERGPLMAGTSWQPGQAVHADVRHRFTNHLFLPVSAPLRTERRFAEIMQEIGLAAHWAQTKRPPDYLKAARA